MRFYKKDTPPKGGGGGVHRIMGKGVLRCTLSCSPREPPVRHRVDQKALGEEKLSTRQRAKASDYIPKGGLPN